MARRDVLHELLTIAVRFLDEALTRATVILREHGKLLDRLARELIGREAWTRPR